MCGKHHGRIFVYFFEVISITLFQYFCFNAPHPCTHFYTQVRWATYINAWSLNFLCIFYAKFMHDWFWSKIKAKPTQICSSLKTETSYLKRIESFASTLEQENCVFQCIQSGECFRKVPFLSSTLQQENGVFESIHSGERFRKAAFSLTKDAGLVWTKGLTLSKSIRF